jgi:hypothetical protein
MNPIAKMAIILGAITLGVPAFMIADFEDERADLIKFGTVEIPTTTNQPQPPAPAKKKRAATVTTTTVIEIVPADAYCPQWWSTARKVGWSEQELETLDFVIWRESRCLADAWNGHDAGLTQINQIHTEFVAVMGWQYPADMFTAEANLAFALKLWQGSGWRPWGLE